MNFTFILNGEDVAVYAPAEARLVDILRDDFGLFGAKAACCSGTCGCCSIIFNGNVVKSCLVPVFKIGGSEIITIEGFSQTDEYRDIARGFSQAGLENCAFCDTAKILATQALLGRNSRPAKEEILSAFAGIKCRCTERDELLEGVMAAVEYRGRTLYGSR